ncbi:MAG: type II secretion system F family protein [Tissierellaceae bacterium]|jgi:type IV pilus assembly protein PilC|nr:type II secretion system F family protein [Tissierellia bacterium]
MIYKYKALTKQGETIEGFFEASDEADVLTMLKSNDYLPIAVEKDIGAGAQISLFSPKVKKKDLAVFCRQFYTMIEAGLGIVKCFEILEAQTSNKTLRSALGAIHEDVQKGFTISEAMNNHDKVFPSILINMIEAGEVSGTLDSILERMARHFEQESKLESKIKSALVYPSALIVVSIAVVIFMLVAVLPTFTSMFTSSGVDLPWPTQLLMNLSEWIKTYWYLLGGGLLIVVMGWFYFISTTEGRRFLDNLKIKIPGIRVTSIKIITARFTRTLSTLLASGIPLLQALEVVGKVLNNVVVQDRLIDSTDGIRRGASLSRAVRAMDIFPPMVDSMINIGEESGALDEILYKTADFYEDEVEMSLQRMTTLIEPVLLVFMAVIIGFIVIAMAMPMFEMVNAVQ